MYGQRTAKLAGAPASFVSTPFRSKEMPGLRYALQVAPEDCTGCSLCVQVCPAKDRSNPRHKALDMVSQRERRDADLSAERRARYEGMHLTGLGTADDVAAAAVYLASRESAFVTGVNLQLDGGSSIARALTLG